MLEDGGMRFAPARIVADVAIGEPRPRPYDSPMFGRLVQQLKDTLADR